MKQLAEVHTKYEIIVMVNYKQVNEQFVLNITKHCL